MILKATVLYRLAEKNISKAGEKDLRSKEVKIVIAKKLLYGDHKNSKLSFLITGQHPDFGPSYLYL